MKKIILSLFLLTASFCFGDWPTWDSLNIENRNDISRMFIIPKLTSDEGINIAAVDFDENVTCIISLRFNKNKVDYVLNIYSRTCNSSSNLYLQLLDSCDFLVDSKFISKLCPEYTGTLRGSFTMSIEEFKKIKKFDLSFSG